jgi:hypothetical protein
MLPNGEKTEDFFRWFSTIARELPCCELQGYTPGLKVDFRLLESFSSDWILSANNQNKPNTKKV